MVRVSTNSEKYVDKVIQETKNMGVGKKLEHLDGAISKNGKIEHHISLLRVYFYKLEVSLNLWADCCKRNAKGHEKEGWLS